MGNGLSTVLPPGKISVYSDSTDSASGDLSVERTHKTIQLGGNLYRYIVITVNFHVLWSDTSGNGIRAMCHLKFGGSEVKAKTIRGGDGTFQEADGVLKHKVTQQAATEITVTIDSGTSPANGSVSALVNGVEIEGVL